MQNFFEKFQALPQDLQDQIITFTEYLEMKQKRDKDTKLKIADKSSKKNNNLLPYTKPREYIIQ